MSIAEKMLFLRSWLRDPQLVGAVAPSSRALAALITSDIRSSNEPVIELGPGTGVFTQALLARGVPRERLVLVEADPAFARSLGQRFPGVRVLQMDAAHLGQTGVFFGRERASAIVSGIPLLAMPVEKAMAIIRGAFLRHLRADGALYQFTYLPRCPVPQALLERMGLHAVRIGFVVANLPPAFVYRFRRVNMSGGRVVRGESPEGLLA
ncbi:class I SAM-dependent methyltransferase [Variovorax sp. EL159]|uniref:class I SAM-dependent methyltransferase n=1 Tax=Variovorax sp. EL159 TaxID=1566270 RepID=UPI0008813730|nr:rRNA adenine N-6-methyltransferase family protein [Variovorax sp. EL159]SCX40302.1 Phospholipid N-methyltransferase [Variovorax sp. EL159]